MSRAIDELVLQAQRELFGWVPVERYQQLFPEENRERIRGRIRRGVWVEGVHWSRSGERGMWVHLRNIKAWIEGAAPEEDPAPAEATEDISVAPGSWHPGATY